MEYLIFAVLAIGPLLVAKAIVDRCRNNQADEDSDESVAHSDQIHDETAS